MISRTGNGNGHAAGHALVSDEVAFGYPRDFLQNQFVYLVISPRAHGLSVGINMNPVLRCDFQCLYCEIDRNAPPRAQQMDLGTMTNELGATLAMAYANRLKELPRYARLPAELLQMRHVVLSGDGEPTMANNFAEVVKSVVSIRTTGAFPFFKIVLTTNSTTLDRPEVQHGLRSLTDGDEIWAKLDGGTQAYISRLNGATISIEKITSNILWLARRRPVVIQSLFPAIDGQEPPEAEIEQYALRLKRLKTEGAQISLVQVYSATRPMARTGCGHLPLRTLSKIARTVRDVAGLRAEVF